MIAKLTFHPLGKTDCTRFDLADGKKLLVDYAAMPNPNDLWDRRIDLPAELKSDLRAAKRDYYDVVCFTHLDDDHCCGAGDFFWLEHAAKYQGEGRIKIRELWVPAAAILEDGIEDSARIVRQEARYRLKKGSGIRVFSGPTKLKEWLEKNGLTLEPAFPLPGPPAAPNPASPADLRAREALSHYDRAIARLKAGDWGGFGAELDAMRPLLKQLSQHPSGR